MIAYGPCVDPWLVLNGGGQDEIEEFFEIDWSLVDYPAGAPMHLPAVDRETGKHRGRGTILVR